MAQPAVFGSYWPANSPVHRLDPRTKLVGGLAAMVVVLLATGFPSLGIVALFLAAGFLLARIPWVQALRSIAPLLFIVVITALLNVLFVHSGTVLVQLGPLEVTSGGLHAAAFLSVRLTCMLLAASLVTLTTTTLDLTDALEKLLTPVARMGFPAHEFSMVMSIALRFLPQFVNEARIIRAAQASRGAQVAGGFFSGGLQALASVAVPLFASVFRHAETLSGGMDARCYHGGEGRTRLHPLLFGRLDIVALCAVVAMAVCVLAVNALA